MHTQSIQSELLDFVQFATSRVTNSNDNLSIEDLVNEWRQAGEFSQAVSDVRQGIDDDAKGKAQTLSDAFGEIRRKLGIVLAVRHLAQANLKVTDLS